MCHQLIFATPMLCPEIPLTVPDSEGGSLWVKRRLRDDDTDWRLPALEGRGAFHFQAGVLSCGCGFADSIPLRDEADVNRDRTLGYHQQLVAYLGPIVAELGRLPLYSSWSGDDNLPVARERMITLDQLLAAGFQFGDRELLWVYPSQAAVEAAG